MLPTSFHSHPEHRHRRCRCRYRHCHRWRRGFFRCSYSLSGPSTPKCDAQKELCQKRHQYDYEYDGGGGDGDGDDDYLRSSYRPLLAVIVALAIFPILPVNIPAIAVLPRAWEATSSSSSAAYVFYHVGVFFSKQFPKCQTKR